MMGPRFTRRGVLSKGWGLHRWFQRLSAPPWRATPWSSLMNLIGLRPASLPIAVSARSTFCGAAMLFPFTQVAPSIKADNLAGPCQRFPREGFAVPERVVRRGGKCGDNLSFLGLQHRQPVGCHMLPAIEPPYRIAFRWDKTRRLVKRTHIKKTLRTGRFLTLTHRGGFNPSSRMMFAIALRWRFPARPTHPHTPGEHDRGLVCAD